MSYLFQSYFIKHVITAIIYFTNYTFPIFLLTFHYFPLSFIHSPNTEHQTPTTTTKKSYYDSYIQRRTTEP